MSSFTIPHCACDECLMSGASTVPFVSLACFLFFFFFYIYVYIILEFWYNYVYISDLMIDMTSNFKRSAESRLQCDFLAVVKTHWWSWAVCCPLTFPVSAFSILFLTCIIDVIHICMYQS